MPWHVRCGGVVLALCAGIANSVALHVLGSFVSHTTGTLSKVGLGVEDSAVADAGTSCLLLLSFITGSAFCGCFIGKGSTQSGPALYDIGLFFVSLLFLGATLFANSDKKMAAYFACCACGLQNGLATQWGTATLRTTHVTGLFTDLGVLTGKLTVRFIRKRCGTKFDLVDQGEVRDDLSKWLVLLSIAVGFLVGVIVGAVLSRSLEQNAFLIPAGITAIASISYLTYRVLVLRRSCSGAKERGKKLADQESVPDETLTRIHACQNSPFQANITECSKPNLAISTDMDTDATALKEDLRQTASPRKLATRSSPAGFQMGPSSSLHEMP
jgi:uncharacterized membrane protein YoaK (UPF0700 family)